MMNDDRDHREPAIGQRTASVSARGNLSGWEGCEAPNSCGPGQAEAVAVFGRESALVDALRLVSWW
jgi:ApbE superfamily uncharacterized protein (UPF0280 family)